MFRLGVTGTREGCSTKQLATLTNFLSQHNYNISALHHGDCDGVDNEVAILAELEGIDTVSHPPDKDTYQAFHVSTFTHPAKNYFARNRDIVDACDLLLVVPKESTPQPKGGTWYTYRYALAKNKPIALILPCGTMQVINNDILKVKGHP